MSGRIITATLSAALLAFAGLTPAMADDSPSAEEIAKINALLAEMQCEMDDDDIEKDGEGYELDDVICVGGEQYDMDLDANFQVVGKRAE